MNERDPRLTNVHRVAVFFDIVKIFFVAILLVGLVRFFVAQPFIVSGDSMLPALASGDYLVVDELTYKFHLPQRGDVVVFRYPADPSMFFIKRIIGLPGDTVIVANGNIYVQSGSRQVLKLLDEPYISTLDVTQDTGTTTLGREEYFVLGDNRNASFDSRIWGPVPKRYIAGRAIARVYPLTAMTLFPGAFTFGTTTTAASTSLSTVK